MEYYTFSQENEERGSGKHHVKNTWVKERYESDEEDGSREEEVNKLVLKREESDDEAVVTSSSTMLTSKVRYLNYGALKHDSAPAQVASGSGGGRFLPPPSNKYHRGHPKFYRCRG
ncbi:hypothetical protein AALP_AA4G105400 [Arabis alpina]|uniref:Uncharacterized protein n=1 Tax=Arabis alpina TaxID=50452 RepID=A0A087H2F5_ARAAL|nr:hypothetical protein AALP_AA4G105400 [Arabis alpina]